MPELPRIAVGTIQPNSSAQPILWALMEALRRRGTQVQSFISRACFPQHKAAEAITGLKPRFLDSWLMSEAVCGEIFFRSSELGDLSLIEGDFSPPSSRGHEGGSLETLCRWLRLPRVVVLDATREGPSLPERPECVDGVFLDRVADDGHLARLTTDVETVWRVPVLGALGELRHLREAIRRVPLGDRPPQCLYRELGSRLAERWWPERIDRLANSQDLPTTDNGLFRREMSPLRITVAVAFDESFNCYFPCGLDLLELRGATVVDFSPLRDPALPPETDIVFLGCGHPERYAAALADNHCMMSALRSHVRWGRRLYAEGGGLAYLCEQMETSDGAMVPMTGVFPAAARLDRHQGDFQPIEVTLDRANWLGHAGAKVRGYRNPSWRLESLGSLRSFLADADHPNDLVGTFQAVGSLMHVNFAAQQAVLNHFFYPYAAKPGF
jgi:cobyrinic acid a,c-diamide synthase